MQQIKTFANLGYNILKSKLISRRQPVFLSLYITNKCNLRCKYCFVVNDKVPKHILRAEYTKEEAFAIIDEFYEMGTRMVFILGGEPLVYKHIGDLVDHIVSKGMYLTICTNGVLIKRKLEEIKKVHTLAVSLDGLGEENDALRGGGVFNDAIEGIKAATAAGVACRIHAVLTRHNLGKIRGLGDLCKELGVTLTVSPPNFLGETDLPYMRITREEYKTFWADFLKMYDEGYPIGNSREAIKKCAEWPTDYHQYIKVGQKFDGYKPTFCLNGHTYVALGAEGVMYNCINLGVLHGPNIKEMGIKKAWERLLEWRPDCVSCASINCIETAMLLDLHWGAIFQGVSFYSKKSLVSGNGGGAGR